MKASSMIKFISSLTETDLVYAEALYLEFFNDYLTIDNFAEQKGLTVNFANHMLEIGRFINHLRSK